MSNDDFDDSKKNVLKIIDYKLVYTYFFIFPCYKNSTYNVSVKAVMF